eukprot:UN01856
MVLRTRVILWSPHERMGYHGPIEIEKIRKIRFLLNFGKDLVRKSLAKHASDGKKNFKKNSQKNARNTFFVPPEER